VLRAVGWMLEQEGAAPGVSIDVVVCETFVSLAMQEPGFHQVRRHARVDLSTLRERARAFRTGSLPVSPGGYAERLRTIGQHLDEHGIWLERLLILPDGHRASGRLNGHDLGQWFTNAMIEQMSNERQLRRRAETSDTREQFQSETMPELAPTLTPGNRTTPSGSEKTA
jgi:hypothetical protein